MKPTMSAALALISVACFTPTFAESVTWGHDLQASISYDPTVQMHVVTLLNSTDKLICVRSLLFAPPGNTMRLSFPNGQELIPEKMASFNHDMYNNINLAGSYVFIRPHGTRPFYVDVRNSYFETPPHVRVKPGRYHYRIGFSYFRCGDTHLADEGHDVPDMLTSLEGELEIPTE